MKKTFAIIFLSALISCRSEKKRVIQTYPVVSSGISVDSAIKRVRESLNRQDSVINILEKNIKKIKNKKTNKK